MTEPISSTHLQRLSDFVSRHFGLHFPQERWPDLQRAASAAARESGYRDPDQFVEELLFSTRRHAGMFASYLTVGETYFFREARSLEVLKKDIVPELIRKRVDRTIKIWSAGCATGEEPYSVAILLSKLIADRENCSVEILATDLNAKSLQKASEGTYGDWSFRGTPAWVRNNYFEPIRKDRWALNPVIKNMVHFAQFNLMDGSLAPHSISANGFDVIFCRNVLMYFTREAMRKIVQQFHRLLAPDGWLIVSPTETSHELFSEFAAVDFGGITLYRKSALTPQKTFVLPSVARGENEFRHRFVEQGSENPETASFPFFITHQPWKDHRTHSENAEELPMPDGQILALDELERHKDIQQNDGELPSRRTKDKDTDTDPQSMLLVARAYANQGNLAAALRWCDKAITADKMAARAYYLRATILQEQGFLSDAVFAFKQTVYVEPQFVLGHFCLGNLAFNQGRLRESEKHFENVLLLLARYEPQEIVLESEGISAGRLSELIVSRRGGVTPIMPEADISHRRFLRAGKLPFEKTGNR